MEDGKIPEGFVPLVKMVMKEQPLSSFQPKTDTKIWAQFLRIALLGGNRSDAEINYLTDIFGKALDFDYVLKTRGEPLEAELSKILRAKMKTEKNGKLLAAMQGLDNELFRVVASIKGGARYFERTKMGIAALNKLTADREKTWEFISELAEDQDVTNVKFTKVILWLHSLGRAQDFSPPSRQIKDFCNKDVGPYYRFYEDDKYFMEKMQEITEEIKKSVKKATVYDVSKAAFYYRACKNMLSSSKGFAPSSLIKFMRAQKLDLKKLSTMLSDVKKRELLGKKLNERFG